MFAFQEIYDLTDDFTILLLRYLAAASANTTIDKVVEAGTRSPPCYYPSGRTITKQPLQQVEGLTYRTGAGVRAEIASAIVFVAPR